MGSRGSGPPSRGLQGPGIQTLQEKTREKAKQRRTSCLILGYPRLGQDLSQFSAFHAFACQNPIVQCFVKTPASKSGNSNSLLLSFIEFYYVILINIFFMEIFCEDKYIFFMEIFCDDKYVFLRKYSVMIDIYFFRCPRC